jgi:glucan-binding YG repeat protein
MNKTLLFAVACAFAGAALGQQYKWTDKNGRVQYGDAPPAGVKAMPLRPPPPAPAAATKPADPSAAQKAQPAAKDREKLAQDEKAAQTKKENCARAQDYLRNLQSGQRLSGIDSKGERYYLDEAQVAQETAKAQRAVQEWCK